MRIPSLWDRGGERGMAGVSLIALLVAAIIVGFVFIKYANLGVGTRASGSKHDPHTEMCRSALLDIAEAVRTYMGYENGRIPTSYSFLLLKVPHMEPLLAPAISEEVWKKPPLIKRTYDGFELVDGVCVNDKVIEYPFTGDAQDAMEADIPSAPDRARDAARDADRRIQEMEREMRRLEHR